VGVHDRTTYLTLGGAYHGDTIGGVSLGGRGFGTEVFEPLLFQGLRAPGYDDPGCFAEATRMVEEHGHRLAALVLEPLVQGAAGIRVAPPDGHAELLAACRAHDVLVVVDEVATGFGRTGTLFACEQWGWRPDLLCLGKGITGGYLPMSATVATGRVFDAFADRDLGERTFYHGHSYGGNALAAAVALRHLDMVTEPTVLANVSARAAQLRAGLAARIGGLPAVGEVRQCGLMAGIELAPPADGLLWGRRVSRAATRRGVLLRPLGDVVIVMPPLSITAAEIDRIVDALAGAIEEITT
jgi:adenosylmethionine-8-amino-7-oxononanoate aminotransferase